MPSLCYENYPLVLHEALAYNVPALVSNVGGMAEKVHNGGNGFTFRIGDSKHLASRLKMLLANPALLNDFKANMSQSPIPTLEQEAEIYENIYYAILNNP